jgi:DNA-binding CsgD family transcriptional regulator
MLVGRTLERAQIDSLLDAARGGRSGVLVVRGEPGVGKTALLKYAADRAREMRVLRAQGFNAEQGLPYAGLSLLLSPITGFLDDLPPGQRRALAAALRLGPPGAIDRFAAYAATLSLLASTAEAGPVLALVDDFHWFDLASAQALMFAARRLSDEGIVIVLAARREAQLGVDFAGIPEMALAGLPPEQATELVTGASGRDIPAEVAERLHRVTAGNPLALLELSRVMTPGQLAGAEPLGDPPPAGADLDAAFGCRIDALSANTRRALLVAAAADTVAVEILECALERASLSLAALGEAEAAGLIALDAGVVEFDHPLVRAATYHRAAAPERRAAHRALAEALQGKGQRDRRAWHLARATLGTDEAVAAELDAVAHEARGRGAQVAAGQALKLAARVTPVGTRRTELLLRAAQDHQFGGAPKAAGALLDEALTAVGDNAVLRARIQHARIHGEFLSGSPLAMQALLRAEAKRVRAVDETQAVLMLIDAAYLCAPAGEAREMLIVARQVAPFAMQLPGSAGVAAQWLLACAEIMAGDPAEGRRLLERALPPLRERPLAAPWIATAAGSCLVWVEEHERGREFLAEIVDSARREGAMLVLPYALAHLADANFRLGHWTSAYAFASESVTLAEDIGQRSELCHSLMRLAEVEAGRGVAESCRLHGKRSLEIAHEFGIGSIDTLTGSALGLLELGLGRLKAAVERLEPVGRFSLECGLEEPGIAPWAQDLTEAYIRLGEHERARRLLVVLERQAERTGGALARAAACRCRGLIADDDEFEATFRTALALTQQRTAPFELARTQLCFGERLRRARRRTDAREQLHGSLDIFVALGAQPWADRALRELRATGERARRRAPDTADQLTPQELQVALIAADGATNKEAAAALFISPKTIETHLNRVYRKLGVRSRVELARRIANADSPHSTD